jgi:hypothetical protein
MRRYSTCHLIPRCKRKISSNFNHLPYILALAYTQYDLFSHSYSAMFDWWIVGGVHKCILNHAPNNPPSFGDHQTHQHHHLSELQMSSNPNLNESHIHRAQRHPHVDRLAPPNLNSSTNDVSPRTRTTNQGIRAVSGDHGRCVSYELR